MTKIVGEYNKRQTNILAVWGQLPISMGQLLSTMGRLLARMGQLPLCSLKKFILCCSGSTPNTYGLTPTIVFSQKPVFNTHGKYFIVIKPSKHFLT